MNKRARAMRSAANKLASSSNKMNDASYKVSVAIDKVGDAVDDFLSFMPIVDELEAKILSLQRTHNAMLKRNTAQQEEINMLQSALDKLIPQGDPA